MLLTEFDEEREWKLIAEGFRELGFDEGKEKGKKEIIKTMLSNGKTQKEIIDFIGISETEFNQIMNS